MRPSRIRVVAWIFALSVVCRAGGGFAQSTLTGVVKNTSGAILPRRCYGRSVQPGSD